MLDLVLLFLKGIVAGFSIAMPVGPVGFLCLHYSVTHGLRKGLASGFGAAMADTLYGAMAAFGLSFLSGFLSGHQMILRIVGGVVLMMLGARMFHSTELRPARAADSRMHMAGAFFSTFFLTLTNPLTVGAFIIFFAAFGVGEGDQTLAQAVAVTFGVFVGASGWWFAIGFGGSFLREKLINRIQAVKRFLGLVIIGFGLFAIGTVVYQQWGAILGLLGLLGLAPSMS